MSPDAAPIARKVPTERVHHGDTFTDPYEWLREKDSPEVLEHLHAENAYTEAVTADQQPVREAIFEEIKHRTVETDLSVPSRRGQYWWFTRTIEGQQHPVYCRVPVTSESWTPPEVRPGEALEGEDVFFDTNAEAAPHSFYSLGGMSVNEAGTVLAYSEDTTGDEHYTLRFRDLTSGENLPQQVTDVHGGPLLDRDGTRAFYMVADSSWRPYRLYQHTVGSSAEEDQLLVEISDPQLWSFPYLSADKKDLLLISGNSEYNETRILDLTDPDAELRLLIGAEHRLEHSVEPADLDGQRVLLITHNLIGPNKSLSVTTEESLTAASAPGAVLNLGRTVLIHEAAVKLDDSVTVTQAQILVTARINTVESVYHLSWDAVRDTLATGASRAASSLQGARFEDAPAEEGLATTHLIDAEFDAPRYRLRVTSWLVPDRIYDAPHDDGAPELLRETPVHDVDLSRYRAERLWVPTGETWEDGAPVEIPVTVMYRPDAAPEGPRPTLVYGYGSYEISMDPAFGVARLSLLDRGIVFAVAHVRGGGELGRRWYDHGKKLAKRNTFTDFIAATDYLVDTGWADPQRVAAMGGSAGGLLMGAVANMAPEKYVAIVAQVPFVDNLTSILDPDLPLSALEWEEWGNPIEDPEVYSYMKSYSPYENVRHTQYPAIAAVTSLHDTRVLYVEPAKWVPALREHQRGDSPIVLKIEMDGGHGGASGRYEQWKDRAWDYGFAATYLGATEPVR